jgi:hypothetical protein
VTEWKPIRDECRRVTHSPVSVYGYDPTIRSQPRISRSRVWQSPNDDLLAKGRVQDKPNLDNPRATAVCPMPHGNPIKGGLYVWAYSAGNAPKTNRGRRRCSPDTVVLFPGSIDGPCQLSWVDFPAHSPYTSSGHPPHLCPPPDVLVRSQFKSQGIKGATHR